MPASKLRSDSAVVKRLQPGAPGPKRLVKRFGEALLGVRYRHDPLRNRRLTTVELIVDEPPAKPDKAAWIRVAYGESELRQRIKEAGGNWHPERKLWLLPIKAVKLLELEKRMVLDA